MKLVAKLALLFLLFPAFALAQGSNIGQEVVVTYSGTVAQLAPPNTPAVNFSNGSTNTFILSVGSTVSVRIYLTNDTANACAGFSVQMFAATDAATSTFNGALQNWQTVPIQSPAGTGGLVPAVTNLTLPPNGAIYVTSAAIQAPKVTIQILNTGGCTTTTMEAVAYVSPVSVTSPLVSATSGNASGATANVQGAYAQGYNGNAINPVMIGGQGLPTNSGFLAEGLDCNNIQPNVASVGTGFFNIGSTPCATQGTNELSVIFETTTGSPGGSSINKPWQCVYPVAGNSCTIGGQGLATEFYNGAIQGTPLIRQLIGSLGVPASLLTQGFTFKQGTARQWNGGGNVSIGSLSANLAGSVIMWAVNCTVAGPCGITGASGLGITYAQVNIVTQTGSDPRSLTVFISTTPNPGGFETITFSGSTGNITSSALLEISNPSPSGLVNPTTIAQTDLTGRIVTAQDAQQPNLWVCNVTLSTNTTTQCQGAPTTVDGQQARPYVTDYVINTTTAGTATTIQLISGTGTNCGTGATNLSAIAYPNTAIGITNIYPFHTPLIGPLLSEVCVKQAGTTAGTSVVEVHGFYAP